MTDLLERQLLTPAHDPAARSPSDEFGPPRLPSQRRPWPVSARLAVAVLAVASCAGGIGWARSVMSDDEQQITELQSEVVQLKADAAAREGRIDQLMWAIDELTFGPQPLPGTSAAD